MSKAESHPQNLPRRDFLFKLARVMGATALSGAVVTLASRVEVPITEDLRSSDEKLMAAIATRQLELKRSDLDLLLHEKDVLRLNYVPEEVIILVSLPTPEGVFKTLSKGMRHVVDNDEVGNVVNNIQLLVQPLTDALYPVVRRNQRDLRRWLSVRVYVQDSKVDDLAVLREVAGGESVSIILKGDAEVGVNAIELVGLNAGLRQYYNEKYFYSGEIPSDIAGYIDILLKDREIALRTEKASSGLIELFQYGNYLTDFDKSTGNTYRDLAGCDRSQLVVSAAAVMKVAPNSLLGNLAQLRDSYDIAVIKGFMREIIEHTPNEFFDETVKKFSRG